MDFSLTLHCPAKINLCLSVTGKRQDGYHDLVSLVTPLEFGDQLTLIPRPNQTGDSLECSRSDIPTDSTNLILKAAELMRQEVKFPSSGLHFHLEKRIPMGAGLGGGSSNGTAALLLINRTLERPLPHNKLHELATRLGSDCALFLTRGPSVVRGRGELVQPAPRHISERRLRGYTVLVCKPFFSIATPWAFGQLAQHGHYTNAACAESTLAAWLQPGQPLTQQDLSNSFESVVSIKYPVLDCLLNDLRLLPGVFAALSGSGSACFALIDTAQHPRSLSTAQARILDHLGPQAFMTTTRIQSG